MMQKGYIMLSELHLVQTTHGKYFELNEKTPYMPNLIRLTVLVVVSQSEIHDKDDELQPPHQTV
jgi:hypothetical protein